MVPSAVALLAAVFDHLKNDMRISHKGVTGPFRCRGFS
jgi:hypothetical protein